MIFDHIRQDLRFAARGLRQKPGFTIAVALTLALGIGANAAMFGVIDRLLFRPPNYMRDAERVHRVYLAQTWDGKEFPAGWFQYTRYTDLSRWTNSLEVSAAISDPTVAVGVGEDAREMRIGAVSASYWQLFDARPVLGRLFTAAEDTTPAGAPVVVLSFAFWQTRYGGRASALGEHIKIGPTDYTVIGVLPEGFNGTLSGRVAVAWIPITTYAHDAMTFDPKDADNWYRKYNISWMQMFVRTKPNVSHDAATADLTSAFRRSFMAQRDIDKRPVKIEVAKPHAIVASVLVDRGPNASETAKVARWVSGVAAIVLLIAAANVANLLLARALRRRREVAVRLALGVSRARLLSQLLTESILLALIGGVAGLLVAQWGGALLRKQFLADSPGIPVVTDMRTLLFAAGAILFVGVVTGLAPALQSRRDDLTAALKSGAREGTYHRSRTRTTLLVFQGALSVMLLVGAGLFVRSMKNVSALHLGYDVDPILYVSVEERGEKLTDTEKLALREQLLQTAQATPGIVSAARAMTVPFWMTWDEDLYVEGIDSTHKLGQFTLQAASPEFFRTMGTRLLRGRAIEPTDTKNSPRVMVTSEAMAKALFPGKDAIGQCVRVGADTAPCTTIVGIAENVRTQDLRDDKMYHYYLPITQKASDRGGLFVRVRGSAARQAETIRRSLQHVMPGATYVTVRPFSEVFEPLTQSWRLGATMFVAFGSLALLLAAIGLYSVIAYNVVQRTHELGVRMAFGAQVTDVLRLILNEGLRLAALGVVIGGAVALWAGRWVAPLLYEVKPTDPWVFALAVVILLAAATLASLIPAMRAARVDPSVALRSE